MSPGTQLGPPTAPPTTSPTQGMVQGLTYKSPSTGRYLKPSEIEWEEDVPVDPSTGEALSSSWEKMSKSKHNGVDPEVGFLGNTVPVILVMLVTVQVIVKKHGADVVRLFTLFKAPPDMAIQWDIEGVACCAYVVYAHSITSPALLPIPDSHPRCSEVAAKGGEVSETAQ